MLTCFVSYKICYWKKLHCYIILHRHEQLHVLVQKASYYFIKLLLLNAPLDTDVITGFLCYLLKNSFQVLFI